MSLLPGVPSRGTAAISAKGPPRVRIDRIRGKGRGVVACEDIAQASVIEAAPVIVIPKEQVLAVRATIIGEYVFGWIDGAAALALGQGSLYNHSATPNAEARRRPEDVDGLHFIALRRIFAGEEILIDYKKALTFKPA